MKFLQNLIYKLHFLSLDVAIGTIIQAFAIQKFTQFSFSSDYLILLPLTTLIIYWLDRILDVYKINFYSISTQKHLFYFKHRKVIFLFSVGIAIYILIKGLFFSDLYIQKLGFYGGSAVIIYFFIHHFYKGSPSLIFFKELTISLIYSLILWILPLIHNSSLVNIIAFIELFLQALLNLWIISWWDKEIDIQMHTHSFAQFKGIEKFIQLLFLLILGVSGLLFYFDFAFGGVYFFMLIGHFLLYRFQPIQNRRILIEMIFWLPIIYLFV